MGRLIKRAGAIGAVLALALPFRAALGAAAVGHASVIILPTPGSVAESAPIKLALGRVTTAGGAVMLSPSGAVTGPAGRSLMGPSRPGAFAIVGPPNSAVVISFSTRDKVTGPGPAMPLGAFTHNAGPSPTLNGAGSLTLGVGASVTVGAFQPYGAYTGSYTVIVNY